MNENLDELSAVYQLQQPKAIGTVIKQNSASESIQVLYDGSLYSETVQQVNLVNRIEIENRNL